MSPVEYILDPMFEAICLGMAAIKGEPVLIDGPEIPSFIHKFKQHQKHEPIAFVSHNAQFDAAILSWRYDFHPDLLIDTIALSRTVLGPILYSHSLATVAAYLGLPSKGTMVKQVKGMTRADIIASGMWQEEVDYCLHDTFLCREIFNRLNPMLSDDEIHLHDLLIRCTTEPVLRLDRDLLQRHYDTVLAQKGQTLGMVEQMGIKRAELMSNPKFAAVLQGLGVDPPMKISPATHEQTYAFAKNDEEFVALLEHPDIMVRTVVGARLETKSTIEETRTKRFLGIADSTFPNLGSCFMPMPVIIGAAHTHRVGGGWDLNVQNLGRGSTLRDAILAEQGYTLLAVDAKQIEARITAWFCRQLDLIQEFMDGIDVYASFASTIFGRIITKADIIERFLGKTGILQLGYACGWVKYQNTVKMQSRNSETPIVLSDEQAQMIVNTYRRRMNCIVAKWRELDQVLQLMHSLSELPEGGPRSQDGSLVMGPVRFYKNCMVGPTGLRIHFPELHYSEADGSWYFRDGRHLRRTYGASLLETIAQHLSRCIVMMAAVRLKLPMAGIGARLVHSAHDELVYHVPNEHIETAKIWAEVEMNRVPTWAAGLPLDCDVGTGRSYGEAK
jgi:hypothetical protein